MSEMTRAEKLKWLARELKEWKGRYEFCVRATLCVELPKQYSTDSIGLAYCADAVIESLDAAGIRYK